MGVVVDGSVGMCDAEKGACCCCCCCCCWKVEGVGVMGDAVDEESERSCPLVVGVRWAA